MSRVKTRTETIAQLHQRNVALEIPSYQRPYIWPTEDVTKLLMDVANARQDGQENYFIGTLISTLGNETAGSYELIDGQQRITTLVLLALAFRERLPDHKLCRHDPAWKKAPTHLRYPRKGTSLSDP
ncbi:DUF262 domain-containing protein [Pseudomonas fluorescens]|uniref:DUF262 domain-containing protein n=1 Tax=Pseudomonas fluorescens TaxID=294 RepID=UPI0006424E68|nr:DUF262 domain-containing protein [Pseudomonas fluorescens]